MTTKWLLPMMILWALIGPLGATGLARADSDDSQRALESARESYEQSRFKDAITILEPLVLRAELPPDDQFAARELLARSYVKAGRPLDGRAMFLTMLRISPSYRPKPIQVPPDEQEVFSDALRIYSSEVPGNGPPPSSGTENAPAPVPPATQEPTVRHFGFGVRLGVTSSALRGKGVDDLKSEASALSVPFDDAWQSGFAIGAVVTRSLSRVLSLVTGAGWIRQSGKIVVGSGDLSDEEKITLDELEIPLVLRAAPLPRLYLSGGFAGAIRLASRAEGQSQSGSAEGTLDDHTRKFGLNLLLGIGAPLLKPQGHVVTAEARYRLGLVDVLSDVPVGSVSFQGVEGSLGYAW